MTQADEFRILLVAVPLVAAILAGMALGSSALTLAASVAALGVAVLSPATGLATLAFMAALKPPPVLPAPGFDLALVASICLGCVYRLPLDRPVIRLSAPVWLLGAYMLYVFAQQTPEMLTGWAPGPDHDVGYRFLQLVAGFGTIVAAAYILSRRSPFPVIAMALAGAVCAAILAIASFEATSVGPPLAGLLAVADDTTRALGPFGNPNYLGAFAAIVVATVAGLLPGLRARAVRTLLVAVAVVVAIALALSLSRAAVVAVLAGLACVAWWRSRRLALALAAAAVIGVVVVYPAFLQWRLESLRGVVSEAGYAAISASDEGRLTGLIVGPQLFLSSPLFGVGFAHYEALSVEIGGLTAPINAHNWYIEVLAEQGIVGVVLWVGIGITLVRDLWRRPPFAQVAGFSALAALAAAGLFLEAPTSYQTVALPLLVVTAALVSDWGGEATATSGEDPTAAQPPGV